MSAGAVRAFVPRPAERWRPTREELLEALSAARDALHESNFATVFACTMVHVVCAGRERPHDARAELRVLGAMVMGRASLDDVAGLEGADFYVSGHHLLFDAVTSAIETPWTWPPQGAPFRRKMTSVLRAVLRRLPDGDLSTRALDALPWPATCPRDEIALVRALGRWRRGER